MALPDDPTTDAALAAWLRTDRSLGIRHYAISAAAAEAASAHTQSSPSAPVRQPPVARYDATGPASISAPPPQARPPVAAQVTPQMFSDPAEIGLPPLRSRNLPPDEAQRELDLLDTTYVRSCTKCGLHANRTQTVFGVGNPRPDIVFVGEGPGADEDIQGLPFVGRAGQLLTRMIAAMTFAREQVYICNVIKCRPPGNRTPSDDEMQTCRPYLFRQLAILRPKVIIALGRPAAQTLLATDAPIGQLRGRFHDFPPAALNRPDLPQAKLMPTFHPAYLLRSPGEKTKAWSDLKQVMAYLSIPIPQA